MNKFKKNSTYFDRKYKSNKTCCKIEIRNFFHKNKIYEFEDLFTIGKKDEVQDWIWGF